MSLAEVLHKCFTSEEEDHDQARQIEFSVMGTECVQLAKNCSGNIPNCDARSIYLYAALGEALSWRT